MNNGIFCLLLLTALMFLVFLSPIRATEADAGRPAVYRQALHNGKAANEGLRRCHRYVKGWLKLADPATGLIPRNKTSLYWNAMDAAADNYSFMVLTSFFTDRSLFEGRMKDMLETEIKLTSRLDRLPDTYVFAKKGFQTERPDLTSILFGSSEYIKDGLLPLTEWLGPSPWNDRMIGILDDMWKYAPVDTPSGKIISDNVEVNGEMLQTLARVYWMTGDEKYLRWAVRLGDYYLLREHHPTRDMTHLRLRDHGCEIVSGLCELYATVHFANPKKKKAYEAPVHEMLDRILEVGRNEHGLFYNTVNPQTGEVIDRSIADTWGYTFNGFYTVYLIDGTERYREASRKALACLNASYRNYKWEGDSSDGYADSIESALNLYNRERVESVSEWLDREIQVMWAKQKEDGVIEGWHGDGNFARTTIMYCLWKTKGITIQPWREDVVLGAVQKNGGIWLTIASESDWNGTVVFDVPRHKKIMKLPLDWPRINQFPEWFTVESSQNYQVSRLGGENRIVTGADLAAGLPAHLNEGEKMMLEVIPVRPDK